MPPNRLTKKLSSEALISSMTRSGTNTASLEHWQHTQRALRASDRMGDHHLGIRAQRGAAAARMAEGCVWQVEAGHIVARSIQANADANTQEAWLRRQRLRRAPGVTRALHEWWQAVPHLLIRRQPQTMEEEAVEEEAVEELVVERETYMILLRATYCILAEDEGWSDEELDRQIEEDWATDSQGAEHMGRQVFCDAVFELCDVWTDGVGEEAYARFLRSLLADLRSALERECEALASRRLCLLEVEPPPPPAALAVNGEVLASHRRELVRRHSTMSATALRVPHTPHTPHTPRMPALLPQPSSSSRHPSPRLAIATDGPTRRPTRWPAARLPPRLSVRPRGDSSEPPSPRAAPSSPRAAPPSAPRAAPHTVHTELPAPRAEACYEACWWTRLLLSTPPVSGSSFSSSGGASPRLTPRRSPRAPLPTLASDDKECDPLIDPFIWWKSGQTSLDSRPTTAVPAPPQITSEHA